MFRIAKDTFFLDFLSFSDICSLKTVGKFKKLLLLPKDASDVDSVWIDFTRISLFAQRHAIRELIYNELRKTKDTFHDFQKTLRDFDDLALKKSTQKVLIPFKLFKCLLTNYGKDPVVPKRCIKLISEGARGKSLAYEKKVDGKTVFPNWEKEYNNFQKLAGKLSLNSIKVKRLEKIDSKPLTNLEKKWIKHRNCMKSCFAKVDNVAQCANFQDPLKPGICWECLLNKMDWSGNEDHLDGTFQGWKQWDEKFKIWKSLSQIQIHCLSDYQMRSLPRFLRIIA